MNDTMVGQMREIVSLGMDHLNKGKMDAFGRLYCYLSFRTYRLEITAPAPQDNDDTCGLFLRLIRLQRGQKRRILHWQLPKIQQNIASRYLAPGLVRELESVGIPSALMKILRKGTLMSEKQVLTCFSSPI